MRLKYFLSLLILFNGRLFAFSNFHGCCLAPDNQTGWVVTLDSIMVLKTTNGGAYWQQQANPVATRRFFDVTCTDELNVWTCGILGQITHSSDGGQTWVNQPPVVSKYATRIEFIDDTLGWVVGGDGVVGRTTDGGQIWEANFTPYVAELYGVSFINNEIGWAVAGWPDSLCNGQGYVLYSTDGGINWEASIFLSGYEDYFDVYFFDLLNGVVVGGNEETMEPIILKTTNGGITWHQIPFIPDTLDTAYYLRAVDFVDSQGWAVGRFGTIIHTTDYGNSWTFQPNPATTTLFDVDFSDSLHGIACGYGIILYTTDGGATWEAGEIEGINEEGDSKAQRRGIRLDVHPNPFSERTWISYIVGRDAQDFSLRVYDASGRLVRKWHSKNIKREDRILWDGTDHSGRKLPQGTYFVILESNGLKEKKNVVLLK